MIMPLEQDFTDWMMDVLHVTQQRMVNTE